MSKTSDLRARFPELYANYTIDRRYCKRVVPMKVLVIGMMRTGTASMRAALRQLGYNDVYHMVSVFENPQDAIMWAEAYDAKYYGKGKPYGREEFDMLMGHCQACCDVPPAGLMPELIAAYPSAKVVITPRDPDSWYKSCMDTVIRMKYSLPLTICRTLDPKTRMLHNMLDKIFGGLFGGREGFVECGKEVYLEKLDEVRRLVPKERLLEYKLGDGWEPLCEFLGNDVPDTPFPRVNDTAEFGVRVQVMGKMAMERVAKTYLAPVGAAVALATAYYVYF